MALSLAARLRRLWLDVHLWLGVGLLLVMIPLGVSGSLLVWHDALDHALYPHRYAVSGPAADQPVQAYAQAAQTAFAGRATLSQIRLPASAGDPVVAVGRLAGSPGPGGRPQTLNAWIDPPTGRVLATAQVANSLTMVIHRLHGNLLIPEVGRKVVGWLGWAMFVSCATGLWLWWPRHGGFLKGLRWRRGASQLFNLHHAVGFWLCLPLAVLALTGVYLAFPQTARALFGVAEPLRTEGGRNPAARFAPPLAETRTGLPDALAAASAVASAAAPGARLSAVNLPQLGPRPSWRIEFAGGRSVQVDDASGRVRPARPGAGMAGPGNADPLSRWMRRIHDGSDMGPVWRTIIFVTGLAPTVLSLTGLVMWLRRRARRRKLAPAGPVAANESRPGYL
jgi:uncharacterized iron-regulated membrane protein